MVDTKQVRKAVGILNTIRTILGRLTDLKAALPKSVGAVLQKGRDAGLWFQKDGIR